MDGTIVQCKVPANVQVSHSVMEVMRNSDDEITITCISNGIPPPTVIWLKNNTSITTSAGVVYQDMTEINATTSRSDLILKRVDYQNGGSYICKATNTINDVVSEISAVLDLIVNGAPEILEPVEYVVLSQNNKAEFSCTFDGYPVPDVQWTFANGSSLPATSQFQVTNNTKVAISYRVSKILTVYGVQCKETSLFSYKCSAINDYNQDNPVESEVFAAGIDSTSLIVNDWESCKNAVSFCKSHGELVVVSTQAVLNEINSGQDRNYWISTKSAMYWMENVSQNKDGCIRIFSRKTGSNLWAVSQNKDANTLCEATRYVVDIPIIANPVVCDGRYLNISWDIVPGSESLAHRIQIYCLSDDLNSTKTFETIPGQQFLMITDLQPRTTYYVEILPLFLGCEKAPLNSRINITTGRENLTAVAETKLVFNKFQGICNISWSSALLSNREEDIRVLYIRTTQLINQKRSNASWINEIDVSEISKFASNYIISNLNPNTDYQVEIGVVATSPCYDLIPTVWSDPVRGTCVTSPSSPSTIELSSKSPSENEKFVSVILTPVSERNGVVSCYLVIAQKGMVGENDTVETDISKLAQADDKLTDGQPYIAMALQRIDKEVEINLGDESLTCCDAASLKKVACVSSNASRNRRDSSSSNTIMARNRPLPNRISVTYYLITATPSDNDVLYAASRRSEAFAVTPVSSGGASPNLGYVPGIVIILIVIVVTLFLMYRRRVWIFKKPILDFNFARDSNVRPTSLSTQRRLSFPRNDVFTSSNEVIYVNQNQVEDGFAKYDIPGRVILNIYASKRRNDDLMFLDEFQTSLVELVREQPLSTNIAKHTENIKKNRFKNISPIDDARVKLSLLPDQPQSDYINASFIDGYSQTAKFIAAQGPKENTMNDFWRMVFEQRCKVIVMVTQLKEGYKNKCEQYWPNPGEEKTFGDIIVRTNNEVFFGDYICRHLCAKSIASKDVMEITQFQYVNWPDHGIPPTTSSLLRLHRAAINAQTRDSGPLLVHCSAGVGRTGTFIALDILSEQMEHEEKINVFRTIYEMRMKRTEMVQSLAQYVYIHKLLAEVFLFGKTDVDVSEFSIYQTNLNKCMEHSEQTTVMQTQFALLGEVPPSFTETSKAKKPANKNLNLVPGILPYDHNLAYVGMTSEDKEVPYLNASNIPAYNAGYSFIIAQDPVPANIHLFWRSVINNGVKCVVMLDEDGSCANYWAENNGSTTFNDVTVRIRYMEKFSCCIERGLEVCKDIQTEPYVVKQIELTNWPAKGIPPSTNTLLETISVVERCRANVEEVRGKKFLALVHCRDGSSQAGAFCAIINLVERLKNENCVDVFRTVKDIRDLRQGAVGNIELYKYCYQAVNEFLESFDLYGNFK
ncbi:uncharacterized protein LOC143445616 isoform X2 [Clavelina lepadiformis]|uniref:uncharacterized protein LOC143445616 isoform X2 n=1 Tax=Clavelina lepadiformis TaxID=159417 RepID=UPI00404269A8